MISSDESDDSFEFDEEQQEILERNFAAEAQMITNNLLPMKSFSLYENVYNSFIKWQKVNNTNSFEESVLLVFFDELSKKYKPSTVWAKWSMLRTTLELRQGIHIKDYHKLKTFMKNFAKNYKPKKAKVLSWKNIETFLDIAEDSIYLCMKVILIFGVCGALRCSEFLGINTLDVQDVGNEYIVGIKDNKNNYPREFVIGSPFYEKVQQYVSLRPNDIDTNRFFICYNKGKCIRQPVGKNKIAEVPKNIALFLNLENPESYTGHCFRRTGATLLSNSGANLVQVKNLGGWRSDSVAQGYIEKSLMAKEKNFEGIVSARSTLVSNNQILASTSSSTINKNPLTENVNNASTSSSTMHSNPLMENVNNAGLNSTNGIRAKTILNDCGADSTNTPCKKRKILKESLSNNENEEYNQVGMVKLYNCENCTITVNNYPCTHKLCEKM